MPTFKDIKALLPAGSLTGGEKVPVSAYLYMTVQQIAQIAISGLSQVTDELSARVGDIENANVISVAEKPYISLLIDEIGTKYTHIKSIADDKGESVADLTIAYNNAMSYLTPLVENMGVATSVNRETMNSLVVAFGTQYLTYDTALTAPDVSGFLTTEEAQRIVSQYAYSKDESDDRYPQFKDVADLIFEEIEQK